MVKLRDTAPSFPTVSAPTATAPGEPALAIHPCFLWGQHKAEAKKQGKGSFPRVWLLQKGDSVRTPAGVAPACHRVTRPRVMETLTLVLTSTLLIAKGN